MSVPAHRRSESKFEVLLKTRDLAIYTATITGNENIFLPKHQWFIDTLNQTAMDIFMECWDANQCSLNDPDERLTRKRLQKEAISDCDDMSAKIYMAHSLFHLRSRRVEYWQEKVNNSKQLIRKWMESDNKR